MLISEDFLRCYCRLIRQVSGAQAVSIFLPAGPTVTGGSALVHDGEHPAVPELATVAAAGEHLSTAGGERPATADDTLGALPEPSRAPAGRLIRLPAAAGGPPALAIGLRFAGEATATASETLSGNDQSVWRRVLELGAAFAEHCRQVDATARGDAARPDELKVMHGAVAETRLIYQSPPMEALLDTIRRVAPTDAGVLVTGESGTGKELVARTVHALSPRHAKPPVVVDCAAISASLIDSELFGHERGAYTGAAGRTVGRLAEAAGSTLILDEIGELPLEVQAKLLRFVQEKQITPVGSTRPRTVDVRLVAVTNRDLEEEVAAGRFRQDLYYRLKVIHAEVPALVERPEDVPLLMDYFIQRFSARYGKPVSGLSPEAAAIAARHSWPGNVRELENRVLQAVILCEGDEIDSQDLDLVEAVPVAVSATLDLDLGQLEKRHIERVLESEDGSVARAAKRLGIQRNTLYQKIKKYGLER